MRDYVVPFHSKLRKDINALFIEYDRLPSKEKHDKILEMYASQYDLIRKSEEELPKGLRHHKGAPLYNSGMLLLSLNTPDSVISGLRQLLLAYIEDLLDFENIKQIKVNPAYLELIKRFNMLNDFYIKLEDIIIKKIRSEQIPKNPEIVLSEADYNAIKDSIDSIKSEIEDVRKKIDAWLKDKKPKEKRVFIGGSYKNIAVLNEISDIVKKLGHIPIMASECNFLSAPPYDEYINDTSIMLLQNCTYAIFEITVTNGHLMEIERSKDFNKLKVILVYQAMDPLRPPSITRMLLTTPFEKFGYTNFVQLISVLDDFLIS